ncbi:type II secretion system F family protein [Poriferisphaera sp. WC338]|uniref:type II secretion system F family protein n=1 Tax=Poriferisphaera sp. WC338 TaxID=3425129 RepID=UPI003D814883
MFDIGLQLAISILVFASVFLLIFAIFRYPVNTDPPVHRSFAQAVGLHRQTIFDNPVLAPLCSLLITFAARFGIKSIRHRIWQQLAASGNPNSYSIDEYLTICFLTSALLGIAALLIQFILSSALIILFIPLLFVAGFYIPLWVLSDAATQRTHRISKQLPYSLDLIAITMQAGSTFTEAIETLIKDQPDEDFNQELQHVLSEIQFGATRTTALQNMATRIPLDSLRSVISAINQADKLGTPLANILQSQADMLRDQRSVRAEKLAASASLRILIPSMLILIAVILILFGPMIIRFIKGDLY